MKSFIVALCLVACACAADEKNAQILQSSYDISPEGNYQSSYDTENGISGNAAGQLKAIGPEAAVVVTGSNSYKSPEGETISLTYIADENGYQPQGSHLPTPPPPVPIPDYIARAIQYIKDHPYTEKKN